MFKNFSVKQKQRLTIGLVCFGVAVFLVVCFYFTEKKKEIRVEERAKTSKKMSLLTDKVEKDLWIAAEGQNIKALEKSNEELTFKLEKVMKELEETKKELKKRETVIKVPPVPPPKPATKTSDLKKEEKKEDVEFPFPEQLSFKVDRLKERSKVERKIEPSGSTIRVFKEEVQKEKKDLEKKTDKKEETSFLPSGSFMKAILLTGIDAPAYGTAQSEPYPVLLNVMDLSVLPNRFRMNLKDCFIIGAGYGNLSDERAYIRTESLSCIRNDGTVIDIGLKGHVIGEDGKLGMRGRLVSKQGQKIAMAMLTGMLGSFAHAFRPQTATVLQLGTEDTGVFRYKVSDVLEAGALGGVGNALNKIADYYIKMADRIFPIIEIDAGREVEVFILKGQELKLQGAKK
jgi:conjugal transfer pilus assembly protein TraB